jgi:hypothetical protein
VHPPFIFHFKWQGVSQFQYVGLGEGVGGGGWVVAVVVVVVGAWVVLTVDGLLSSMNG